MLIDAAHPEETRVVVLDGTRVEEFDFESQSRRQLRGNIYLAKVTRVEPSLQAAFIEYGGNRHGFLAFNDIHPDYFQIPLADREALLREAAEDDDADAAPSSAVDEDGETASSVEDDFEVDEEIERRRRRMLRRYKIQEVIKRRQIMLVQVVKEERGNKGAALTTYLSLAGRYCVLMPNTDRGGGISRKITSATDRKRLRGVVQSLEVPKGMGLIVRTAGAKRTKAEIKRDYDYLVRAWENIRDTTLHSIAPALIYEEEDLVKRAIRDLYDKELDGIWVEGDAGFKEARDFMRMLMPAQAKKVIHYREPAPLFVSHRIEDHLSQIYSPVVPLKSGGYLVINQTEALVAIDVNSGRSTRERNIETTALKTNLEAAEEACRQLRLRDLAGLIVIDFIDMDEAKNNRAVEKKLKDCLKDDRARVQMGKISSFGLMELSRQRRRSGILEGTTHVCPRCQGAGRVRSVESSALSALRAVEMEALRGGGEVALRTPKDVGVYILNAKRDYLVRIRQAHGLWVNVVLDDVLGQAEHQIDRISSEAPQQVSGWEVSSPAPYEPDEADLNLVDEEDEELEEEEIGAADEAEEDFDAEADVRDAEPADGRARRGRRRRRGRRGDEPRAAAASAPAPRAPSPEQAHEQDAEGRRRRRRGRRGGRRAREDQRPGDPYAWAWPARPVGDDAYQWRGPVQALSEDYQAPQAAPASEASAPALEAPAPAPTPEPEAAPAPQIVEIAGAADEEVWVELPAPEEKPKRSRRSRSRRAETAESAEDVAAATESAVEAVLAPEPTPEPMPEPVLEVVAPVAEPAPVVAAAPASPPEPDPAEILSPPAAPRRGWWRRGA
jgi:ribonuclease E